MHKNVRISRALLNNRLSANILNIVILTISTIILYFIILYLVFGIFGSYVNNKNKLAEIEERYSLNLSENATTEELETALKDFYFNSFSEEICAYYKKENKKDYSITRIYNIVVLGLPANPSYDNYKTDYFQYVQNADGSFNTDVIGTKVTGYGDFYERNLHDLFYNAYNKLDTILEEFDLEYYRLKVDINANEMYSRVIAFAIAFLVMYIILPLCNQYYQVGFERKFDLACVNLNNGYLVGKYKIILKNVTLMFIPFIGVIFANKYSIIILSIGYLFLDNLLMLFTKNNTMIEESLYRIDVCSVKESLIFKTKEEENEYINSEEFKKINDIDFLEKLKLVDEININEKKQE